MNWPNCLWSVGEVVRTDDGVECEIVKILGPFSFMVKRLDTGELVSASMSERRPPKGWVQIADPELIARAR